MEVGFSSPILPGMHPDNKKNSACKAQVVYKDDSIGKKRRDNLGIAVQQNDADAKKLKLREL